MERFDKQLDIIRELLCSFSQTRVEEKVTKKGGIFHNQHLSQLSAVIWQSTGSQKHQEFKQIWLKRGYKPCWQHLQTQKEAGPIPLSAQPFLNQILSTYRCGFQFSNFHPGLRLHTGHYQCPVVK